MEKPSEQKSTFGISQIGNETPMWAKNIFRVYFFASKAVIGWLGYTKLIPAAYLYETMGFVTLLIDPIVYGLSKMVGVLPEQSENDKQQ
jgi:hypothetical protein